MFQLLAGLYESWLIPLAVILVVPLGVIDCVLVFALTLRGMPNDVYLKVGIIAIIGLFAKHSVLIVQFAKDHMAEWRSLVDSAIAAANIRSRPIVMRSLVFALGIIPLTNATGPSSASQNAIGTSELGGMISATALAVFFVPVFFVFVLRILGRCKTRAKDETVAAQAAEAQVQSDAAISTIVSSGRSHSVQISAF